VATARTYQGEILAAEARIRSRLPPTPLVESRQLGAFLKLETLQPTGSFKVRGALAALTDLDPGTHVVAASAGNHALAVAWAAAELGLQATVVVPANASRAKIAALARSSARLVCVGSSYDEAEAYALELADPGLRYVSAYNDRNVIAGGGTLALEVARELEAPLTFVCPVGGGGLCAGVALWASCSSGIKAIGVEAAASRAVSAALRANGTVPIEVGSTLADGLAGNLEPGSVTVELIGRHAAGVVSVSEAEIEAAIRFLAREHGLVVEGAGAVATAALLAGRVEVSGTAVALVTGRNIEQGVLAGILGGR
jgi:threonine dehydratase